MNNESSYHNTLDGCDYSEG